MDLSIIILNWNTTDYLDLCLRSIFRFTWDIDYEIIVIDNNSKDKKSVNKLKKEYPRIRLLLNKKNIGFGKANNQGISLAKGNYILTLNNDTELIDNLFKKMFDFIKKRKKLAALVVKSFKSKKKDRANTEAYKREMTPFTLFLNEVFYPPLQLIFPRSRLIKHIFSMACDDENKNQYAVHLNGSCMLYRKEAIDDVGMFNPAYFLFCSETEWCKKALKKGWRLYYLASSYIIHKGGRSLNLMSRRTILFDRDYSIFLKNNYGTFSVVLYKLLRIIMINVGRSFYFFSKSLNKD